MLACLVCGGVEGLARVCRQSWCCGSGACRDAVAAEPSWRHHARWCASPFCVSLAAR